MSNHLLHFEMNEYFHLQVVRVTCPYEERGVARPCAVWEEGVVGDTKRDECSLASWVDAAGGLAEDFGFFLPGGSRWIAVINPLPVKYHFIGDDLEVWPAHLEAP